MSTSLQHSQQHGARKTAAAFVAALMLLASPNAFAQSSIIEGSVNNHAEITDSDNSSSSGPVGAANQGSVDINRSTVSESGSLDNQATISNEANNTAEGLRSDANMGSIQLKHGSTVNAEVRNDTTISGGSNTAWGTASDANMGSVQLQEGSTVDGWYGINNRSRIEETYNGAGGANSEANVGSVSLRNASTISGAGTLNDVEVRNSSNYATTDATANMASVQLDNTQMEGLADNYSSVTNSYNSAYGKGADANMGSVQLKDTTVTSSGSIVNSVDVSNYSNNYADAQDSVANMGSVRVENSEISGDVNNSGSISGSYNNASTAGSRANSGSVDIH